MKNRLLSIMFTILILSLGFLAAGQQAKNQKDQPKREFQAARQAFQSGDHQQAARHIQQAAEYLRGQIDPKSQNANAEQVRQQSRDLDQLADRVRQGQVQSADALNQEFAQSYRTLANYQYQAARTNWQQNQQIRSRGQSGAGDQADREKSKQIGYYLNAAAENTQNFLEETGEAAGDAGQAALDGARKVGGLLIEGAGWTTEQVGEGIDTFGNWFENLGESIQPGTEGQGNAQSQP